MAVLGVLGTLVLAGVSPPVAQAICAEPPCHKVHDDEPPPPPAPATTTTITDIAPAFAWSGDTIVLTGTGFTGATASVNGMDAAFKQRTATQLTITVPDIPATIVGPVAVPVVVTSPTGTASTTFTLSPTMRASASATYGENARFGQGMDGSARARATLDRASGVALSELTVHNTQSWLSLTINMSTVWLDAEAKVVGYTTPKAVTSTGWMFHWPSGDTTATGEFNQAVEPHPGVAPFARSARIVLVRDHEAELLSTLENAVELGRTIVEVVSTLGPFLV